MMKKFNKISKLLLLLIVFSMTLTACSSPAPKEEVNVEEAVEEVSVEETSTELAQLPAAQTVEGDYSFENSGINSANLVDFLNREDTVYIDLRNYEDYSKKHFKNFEVIPFFAFIFDENAGTEGFPQLFNGSHDAPVPVYESSESVLKALFPKDKNLMIMCQSGGRVAMLMKMLAANGYDMTKVYNVGGLAQYTGSEYRDLITDTEELNVEVKYIINAE